ncbi:MAG: tRNA pseudouridine(38-40) synthase TruA [Actinomycetia bacterium]|nr:tRNA pseudouridine(38-40) synthase TruA [Actinomycetes bacterium]MCP4085427.1 tRNA pseudouridine(38-40) synthase TruA [Actinomycetes bacterium]
MTTADPGTGGSAPVRVRMTVAYNGTGYRGFWAVEGQRTVAGDLVEGLEKVLRHPIELTCAGRTDAGVHATGQVVSFDADPNRLDPERLQASLNGLLAPAIAVREVGVSDPDFDARFSARARWYRYRVRSAPVPDPLRAGLVWPVRHVLDGRAMNEAARQLVGEHDFTSFCRRPKPAPDGTERSLVRRVIAAQWGAADDEWHFEIGASAFCHQMVRSITGTLVDIGRGRLPADAVSGILAAQDRNQAGTIAPPQGLVLHRVDY